MAEPYVPYRRACLLRPYNEVPHLFVVLNDPCKDGFCLCVMVTSIKEKRAHDPACVLKAGDHEFIKQPSYMLYRMAEQERAATISNLVGKKYYSIKPDMSEEVFAKIIEGLYSSEETRPRIITYLEGVIAAQATKPAAK